MNILDCRNLSCPAPVIAVKNALQTSGNLSVRLDDGAPRENVVRFARNRGYTVSEERDGAGWLLTISGSDDMPTGVMVPKSEGTCVFLITSDRLGDGPEELGRLLMKNFIHTLLETATQPTHLLFMNSGVYLTCEGSDVIEALGKLVNRGVEVFSCGLCLDYFDLKERLKVGATTNMLTTAEYLLSAGLAIKL